MKRIAIVQSNYIPWKGYFDLINRVDEFVLLDSVQFTRRDWRNRNRIKTAMGTRWLTIPVTSKGRYHQRIDETEIEGGGQWSSKHWRTLRQSYVGAPHFDGLAREIEALYEACATERMLSAINRAFIVRLRDLLGISTHVAPDSSYAPEGERADRLLDICLKAEATHYLSGPAARAYIDESLFERAGITVEWMDYEGYPTYPQPHNGFEHSVSVLDLLFSVGPEQARKHMLSFSETDRLD